MPSTPPPIALDAPPLARKGLPGFVQWLILKLDARLRRDVKLIDVGAPNESIFRVGIGRARRPLTLSDGSRIAKGDPVIEIHFLNARLPQAHDHTGLGWAANFGRKIVSSFRALAAAVEEEPALAGANAVVARLAFAGERNRGDTRRFGEKFGLETLQDPAPMPLGRQIHDFGEDLWLVGLTWVFNPGALKGRSVLRLREDLWISRGALVSRYGRRRERR